jgi:hypothetical protein
MRPQEPPRTNARRRFCSWWRRQFNVVRDGSLLSLTLRATHGSAIQLLNASLSQQQRDQLEKRGYFEVIGGTTGKCYRIRSDYRMNVEELDKNGRRVCLLCFVPRGRLMLGNIMLAQKLALELFETQALAAANKISTEYDLSRIVRS